MSTDTKIKAAIRTEFGKGAARRARRDGNVPAVLYGHGADPRHLNLDTLEFAAILRAHGTNAVLELDIEGETELALVKQITVHPVRRHIEHTDLLIVKKGEKVEVEVPVVLTGTAQSGTLVTTDADTLRVLADALAIPEQFEYSIQDAQAGLLIHAGDIDLPAGVELIDEADFLIGGVYEAPSEADMAGDEEEGESTEAPAASED